MILRPTVARGWEAELQHQNLQPQAGEHPGKCKLFPQHKEKSNFMALSQNKKTTGGKAGSLGFALAAGKILEGLTYTTSLGARTEIKLSGNPFCPSLQPVALSLENKF